MALAQIGDLVRQLSTVLTTVSSLNPIKVYFQISEQPILISGGTRWLTAAPKPTPNWQLIFANGWIYPEKGKFFFADR
jgi:membrane fusion protein, multidrug efflux system